MKQLNDIRGDVRGDGQYYSLKSFVQPFDPLVMKIASVLNMSEDPIETAQDFVHKIIKYREQNVEYWGCPAEVIESGEGDCDEMAVLLCSIIRNYLPPESVFIAVGNMKGGGHAWVVANGKIIESTANSERVVDENDYEPEVIFNDRYTYAEANGFGFILVKNKYRLKVM